MNFSIRDLLLGTMIVAQVMGWWAHRRAMNENALTHTLEWIPPAGN